MTHAEAAVRRAVPLRTLVADSSTGNRTGWPILPDDGRRG